MSIDNKIILENSKELSILYVEDDNELREATSELLSSFFKRVDTAVDGAEGLKKYKEYLEVSEINYDLVISDIQMPILNGIEMVKEIKKINQNQLIIFITAFNEFSNLHDAIELGVSAFLIKPISIDRLKSVLYTTTQVLSDRNLVKAYYTQIEDLVVELKKKNDYLEHSRRVITTITKKETLISPSPKDDVVDYSEELDEFKREEMYYIQEIYYEIDASMVSMTQSIEVGKIDTEALESIFESFKKYTAVIELFPFFNELSHALVAFVNTIQKEPLPEDIAVVKNIFMIFESFIFVLENFHEEIAHSDSKNINKLDASIISDIKTIENMWLNRVDEQEYEEMEFF